jgi:hypothetical protein
MNSSGVIFEVLAYSMFPLTFLVLLCVAACVVRHIRLFERPVSVPALPAIGDGKPLVAPCPHAAVAAAAIV